MTEFEKPKDFDLGGKIPFYKDWKAPKLTGPIRIYPGELEKKKKTVTVTHKLVFECTPNGFVYNFFSSWSEEWTAIGIHEVKKKWGEHIWTITKQTETYIMFENVFGQEESTE